VKSGCHRYALTENRLMELYDRLLEAYGPQYWWPAETPFEVMAGAVLTQNTAWVNVEQAIENLRHAALLCPDKVLAADEKVLAACIRPSGYFNIKASRLKNLCSWIALHGGIKKLSAMTTCELRDGLLGVKGIGPETADDILLYAFNRPVFVIDTYTRRLLAGLGWIAGDEGYEELRQTIESRLGPSPALFNEYHALIVRHAKQPCDRKQDCRHCRAVQAVT